MKETSKSFGKKSFILLVVGVILISSGVISENYQNRLYATDEGVKKQNFSSIAINDGAKIFLGNEAVTYVGGNTVLFDKIANGVTGDSSSINNAANNILNTYYKRDSAAQLGMFRDVGLPTLSEIKTWKDYIPTVSSDYWLNDTKDDNMISQYGYTPPPNEKLIEIAAPLRGYAKSDNTLEENSKTISGIHSSGAWFDSKVFNFGNYAYSGSSTITFTGYTQPVGYWYDPLGDAKFDYGKDNVVLRGISSDVGNASAIEKDPGQYLRAYATPNCEPKDEVFFERSRYGMIVGPYSAGVYNPSNDTYRFPAVGETIEKDEIIVSYIYEQDYYSKINPDQFYKITVPSEYKSKLRTLTGSVTNDSDKGDYRYPGQQIYKTDVYVVYSKMPRDVQVSSYITAPKLKITGGMWYNETERTIPASSLESVTNAVRPKMTLSSSGIKFARSNTSANIPSNATLGDMPITTLLKNNNYKLVVNNAGLGVNKIAKGITEGVSARNTTATEEDFSKATISEDNVISVTPGTTEITIPVSTLGGNKVSALSTKKDGSTETYGIVGDVMNENGSVTINIADLMDTSKVTSKSGQSKTITLFNEQQNRRNYSDEISIDGLDITIKVENPQAIDFTEDTKTNVLTQTYAYGDTFTVEAEVTKKGAGDIADTVTGIAFSADSDYLEIEGSASWNPTTLKGEMTFKVIKPYTASEGLKIKISRAGSDTHDPAPDVMSANIKTEKRKIDINISPSIFDSEKGSNRLSLKAGQVMPDISQEYSIYKSGSTSTSTDEVATSDKDDGKIPYNISTKHWLGKYNGANKDSVLVEDGKVLHSVSGNIWKINLTKGTDGSTNNWFDERYEVINISPKDAIVDVYDVTGNQTNNISEILYVNNISMSLADYKTKFGTTSNKAQSIIDETSFKVTGEGTPYKEVSVDTDSPDTLIRILKEATHAGSYDVQFMLDSGSYITSKLVVADALTVNTDTNEEVSANTYIHQKGTKWPTSINGQMFDEWMQIRIIDLKTGEKKVTSGFTGNISKYEYDVTSMKRLGETPFKIYTKEGTILTHKIIVRDHAITTGDVRMSSNDLLLTVDEATALVKKLEGKSVTQKVSILTPDSTTDPDSKYGMYPYATLVSTGNKVTINGIEGLPEIKEGKTSVEDGVYDVTFTTAGGGTVTAKITVYVSEPDAYVEIPKTIKLEKSENATVEAEQSAEVKLVNGAGEVLTSMNNKIVIDTPSTFDLTGTSEANASTKMKVTVYDETGTTEISSTDPLTILDASNVAHQFMLKVKKSESGYSTDVYKGKMQFTIRFQNPLSESGG